jgi:hypothetical protein
MCARVPMPVESRLSLRHLWAILRQAAGAGRRERLRPPQCGQASGILEVSGTRVYGG